MEDFHKWFEELKSNSLWWMRMNEMYGRKNLDRVAGDVHLYLLASINRLKANDFQDFRRLFQSFAQKAEDAPVKPQLQQVEEKKTGDWKPASPEHVDKCANQILEMIKNSPMINGMPRVGYKQSIEEGGWLPKKEAPYPQTSAEEAYVRQRHLEYVKRNYEPRTGQPLPDWIPEHEFNLLYDNEML